MLMFFLLSCAGSSGSPDDTGAAEDTASSPASTGSAGCGLADALGPGGVQVEIDAGSDGDGLRSFWLSLPADYDPDQPHAVIIGYPGTNWVGQQIQPYLDLEAGSTGEIFVYPDPLWRDFDGWGNLGGWVLGEHAAPADGMGDIAFTGAILDLLEASYCVDTDRVFATGHSWGGDMAQVISCFLGDRITAAVPVAANRPYWFEDGSGWVSCTGDAAVWTMFGVADDHFTWQDYPGQYGDECRDFWLEARGCAGGTEIALDYGADGECVSYEGCSSDVRYCLYGPESGHQIPSYYAEATMDYFRSF